MSKDTNMLLFGKPFSFMLSIISNRCAVSDMRVGMDKANGAQTISIYLDKFSMAVLQPVVKLVYQVYEFYIRCRSYLAGQIH